MDHSGIFGASVYGVGTYVRIGDNPCYENDYRRNNGTVTMSKTRNPDALIRIEDAIKVLCRKYCCPGPLCPDGYCVEMWDEFEDVERVDAVQIVRCKDCSKWCICHHSDNWFCADGTPINTASDFYDDKGKRLNNPSTYKSVCGERKDDDKSV